MQFAAIARPLPGAGPGTARARESLRIIEKFANWEPPAGLTQEQLFVTPGGGAVVILSTDDAGLLIQNAAEFSTIAEIEFIPIMPVEQGLEYAVRGLQWAVEGSG